MPLLFKLLLRSLHPGSSGRSPDLLPRSSLTAAATSRKDCGFLISRPAGERQARTSETHLAAPTRLNACRQAHLRTNSHSTAALIGPFQCRLREALMELDPLIEVLPTETQEPIGSGLHETTYNIEWLFGFWRGADGSHRTTIEPNTRQFGLPA